MILTKDRNVEFPNRYLMEPVEGMPGVVDLTPVPGKIIDLGTPWNKPTWLSDETAVKLWPDAAIRPEDPTVNEALARIPDVIDPVGTIKTTMRTDLGSNWLLCNGEIMPKSALYDAMPEIDITSPLYWKSQYLLGQGESARFLYDNGILYAATLVDSTVYVQETSELADGFSSPRAIMTIGFQDNTITTINHFKKLRNYFVFSLGCSGFETLSYSVDIYGTYTHQVLCATSYATPSFLGCTDKIFYYVVSAHENSDPDTQYLDLYYATTINNLQIGGYNRKHIMTQYGYNGGGFSNVVHVGNNDYLAVGATPIEYANGGYRKYVRIVLVDLRDPSDIKTVAGASAGDNTGPVASVFLIDGVFYGAFHTNTGYTYLYLLGVNGETKIVEKLNDDAYVATHNCIKKGGKLYFINDSCSTMYEAASVEDFYGNIREKYQFSSGGININTVRDESGIIVMDDLLLAHSDYGNPDAISNICTKYLPEISLADLTYTYVRSD